MQVKLHFVQIALICALIVAVFFAGQGVAITNNCPQPIVNNYIDVNVMTPPIVFDKGMFEQKDINFKDLNFSPNIVVNVSQKPVTVSASPSGGATTYVTNNYITDVNTPVIYYQFSVKASDANGNIILNDVNAFADGTPALAALQKMASIEYSQFVYGAMIISINGVRANEANHEYWALYQDGAYSSVGISDIVVNKPTSIEWKIESW